METKSFLLWKARLCSGNAVFWNCLNKILRLIWKSTGMTSAMSKFLRRTAEVGSFAVVCGRHFYDDACRVAGTDKGRQKGIGGRLRVGNRRELGVFDF